MFFCSGGAALVSFRPGTEQSPSSYGHRGIDCLTRRTRPSAIAGIPHRHTSRYWRPARPDFTKKLTVVTRVCHNPGDIIMASCSIVKLFGGVLRRRAFGNAVVMSETAKVSAMHGQLRFPAERSFQQRVLAENADGDFWSSELWLAIVTQMTGCYLAK